MWNMTRLPFLVKIYLQMDPPYCGNDYMLLGLKRKGELYCFKIILVWQPLRLQTKVCPSHHAPSPPEAPFGCGRSRFFSPQLALPQVFPGSRGFTEALCVQQKAETTCAVKSNGVCQVCYGLLSSLESSHRTVDVNMSHRRDTVCSEKACGVGYQPCNAHACYRPEVLLQEYSHSKEGDGGIGRQLVQKIDWLLSVDPFVVFEVLAMGRSYAFKTAMELTNALEIRMSCTDCR